MMQSTSTCDDASMMPFDEDNFSSEASESTPIDPMPSTSSFHSAAMLSTSSSSSSFSMSSVRRPLRVLTIVTRQSSFCHARSLAIGCESNEDEINERKRKHRTASSSDAATFSTLRSSSHIKSMNSPAPAPDAMVESDTACHLVPMPLISDRHVPLIRPLQPVRSSSAINAKYHNNGSKLSQIAEECSMISSSTPLSTPSPPHSASSSPSRRQFSPRSVGPTPPSTPTPVSTPSTSAPPSPISAALAVSPPSRIPEMPRKLRRFLSEEQIEYNFVRAENVRLKNEVEELRNELACMRAMANS